MEKKVATRLLNIGLAITGLIIGYMVGASSTPVVGAAIPVIFGLVATAFALLQKNSDADIVSKAIEKMGVVDPNNLNAIEQLMSRKEAQNKRTFYEAVRDVGAALIVFSLCYFAGTLLGGYIRLNNTFNWAYPDL